MTLTAKISDPSNVKVEEGRLLVEVALGRWERKALTLLVQGTALTTAMMSFIGGIIAAIIAMHIFGT